MPALGLSMPPAGIRPATVRQCAVLVGGLGTRLGALTADTPKPLLPCGDRPFLAWLLREFIRFGVEEFVLLTGHLSDRLRDSLAGIAALGSTAFSDRNLKTDIRKIGESDSGFPLYMFRYIGEAPGTTHIGLMAQDVQKKRPESVIKTPIGLAVDYIGALAA